MKKQLINHLILVFSIFVSCNLLLASDYKGRTTIDSLGYYISPSLINPDGNWVIANKRFTYTNKSDSIFYINTKTKQKVHLPNLGIQQTNMLYNDLILLQDNQKLSVKNLRINQNTYEIDNVKQFSSKGVKDNNLLITLSNNNTLKVIQLNKKGKLNKVLFSDSKVTKYLVNSNKTKLIYLRDSKNNTARVLDLESLESLDLTSNTIDLDALHWNNNQKKIAFLDKGNKLQLIDLNTAKTNTIQLSLTTLERFELYFYSNDDLFIKYNIKTDETIVASEYLDIWNGNTRFIHPSTFKEKKKLDYKAFVYKYQTDSLKELDRARNFDYHFINIPNHILTYNPFKYYDVSRLNQNIEYSLVNTENTKVIHSLFTYHAAYIINDANGRYIIYPKNENKTQWEILDVNTQETFNLLCDQSLSNVPIWSKDSKYIFHIANNTLTRLDISNKKMQPLVRLKPKTRVEFLNKTKYNSSTKPTIDTDKPTLFVTQNTQNTLVYQLEKNKSKIVIDANGNSLSKSFYAFPNLVSKDLNTIVFTIENYDLPISIKAYHKGKTTTILDSKIPEHLYSTRKKQTIFFQEKFDRELKGTLYYPKDFDKNKKYPMVVYNYAEDETDIKEFLLPTALNSAGFNIPLLNDNGYFVFYVQSYVSDQGPAISALESVTSGIKAILKKEPAINDLKLGLIGHSFGGYKASYIATQTNIFSAIISGAGSHDNIGGAMYRYNTYRNGFDLYMAERGQYRFKDSYAENPQKYLDNSPILHAHQVKTPMLMWTGLKDENVHWENTRSMFVALKRYQIPTIALFYKNVDHSIMPNQFVENRDLTFRVIDWFDYFLKDYKDIDWINKGINYDNYSWNQLDTF